MQPAEVIQLDSHPRRRKEAKVSQNRDTGFAILYRSLRWADWAKGNPARKAFFIDCILQAQHSDGSVNYRGKTWELKRGQLVICASEICTICGWEFDRTGRKKAERLVAWFEAEGMLRKLASKDAFVLEVSRYDAYQEQNSVAPNVAGNVAPDVAPKASGDVALSGGDVAPNVAGNVAPDVAQNNNEKNNKVREQEKDLSSRNASDDTPLRADAAVQSHKGQKWGTADDLKTAEWIAARVAKLVPSTKAPNLADWANEVRLMRELDQRDHKAICALFDAASRDTFWWKNVLSPAKLRKQWDRLTAELLQDNPNAVAKAKTTGFAWTNTTALTNTNTPAEIGTALRQGCPWHRVPAKHQQALIARLTDGTLADDLKTILERAGVAP